jgi:ParB family chromosome partitioning protein
MAKKLVFANNPLLSGPSFGDREKSVIPYREIEIASITRDPNQPRVHFEQEKLDELTDSIKTYGVLTPIIVRAAKIPGKYIVVAGERRYRAATKAGLKTIPAIVDREPDQTGERTLAIQLVENLQRADLTPLEKAHAIGALKESYSLSIRDVAEKLGISKSMVQRSLDILDLPADLLNALREGASESKILLLAKVTDPEERARLLKDIDSVTRDEMSTRLVVKEGGLSKTKKPKKQASPEDQRIADEIQRSLGLKVNLIRQTANPESGKLTIDFYSDEDLQAVFRKLVAE